MKSGLTKLILPLLCAVALTGCAGLFKTPQPLTYTPSEFPSGQYTAKYDNFQILLDASQTMGNDGQVNFLTAKNFIGAVNSTLPADFPANMGLRSFGHSERQSKNLTDLVAGMAKYARADLGNGLDKVKYPGGNTPMGAAINGASADLEKASGTSALVIVSDGTRNNQDDILAAAKAIKAKMGDRICIYTVWIGDDLEGKKLLENVSKEAGCGFTESAANLTDPKSLADYVEKVFLNRKPAPAVVVAPVAPVAPPVAPPVAEPCKGIITANLVFDFDKATIKEEMLPALEEAKRILDECRTTSYELAGHTCNIGTDAYNQGLSERRAKAIQKWLVDNGVAAGRLDAVGYGEKAPKYDNKTNDGRKLNRRVEFKNK